MKRFLSSILSLVFIIGICPSAPVTATAASVDDLTFELNDDGNSYSVTDCDEKTSGEVVIPDTYNGLPVTKILGYGTFADCSEVTSITIPCSIEDIDDEALSGGCENLKEINVDKDNTKYCSIDGVLFNKEKTGILAFPEGRYGCYAIPDGVEYINGSAFFSCSIQEVKIPDSVKKIGWKAFYGCENLVSVNIPDTVTEINIWTFSGCGFESIVIPDSVTIIYDKAFSGCKNLSTITIPDSVISIADYAFYGCNSLFSITIPNSVTSIGLKAFGYYLDTSTYDVLKNDDFVVYGVAETAAETYANENGFAFIEIKEECEHKITNWITDKKATVYKAGSKHKECTLCGETLESATINQLKCSKPTLKTIANTTTGVKITWGKVTGADSYRVYRKVKGGSWGKLADITSIYYTDKTAKSGTTYYYTVRAENEAGLSDHNTTGLSVKRLANPKLTKKENTANGVKIAWGKVTGASGYIVYRKTSSGSWKQLVKTTKTTYTDKTAKSGTTYYYTVCAYSGSVKSSYDTTGLKIKYLADPVLKIPTSTKSGVTLKWSKVTGANGYIVYRKTGNGSYSKLATVKGVSKVSYLDKTAKKNKKYTYKVKAYYGKTYSAYSNAKTIKDKY